jgi:hypothetical protein
MARSTFEQVMRDHWLKRTKCAKGYVVSLSGCGNYVPFKTPAPG